MDALIGIFPKERSAPSKRTLNNVAVTLILHLVELDENWPPSSSSGWQHDEELCRQTRRKLFELLGDRFVEEFVEEMNYVIDLLDTSFCTTCSRRIGCRVRGAGKRPEI